MATFVPSPPVAPAISERISQATLGAIPDPTPVTPPTEPVAPVPPVAPQPTVPPTEPTTPPSPAEAPPEPPTEPTFDDLLATYQGDGAAPLVPDIADDELKRIATGITGKSGPEHDRNKFVFNAFATAKVLAKSSDQGGIGYVPTTEQILSWNQANERLSNISSMIDAGQGSQAIAMLFTTPEGQDHPNTIPTLQALVGEIAKFDPALRDEIFTPIKSLLTTNVQPQIEQARTTALTEIADKFAQWAEGEATKKAPIPAGMTEGQLYAWVARQIKNFAGAPLTPPTTPQPTTPPPARQDDQSNPWKQQLDADRTRTINTTFQSTDFDIANSVLDSILSHLQIDLNTSIPVERARQSWRQDFLSEIIRSAYKDPQHSGTLRNSFTSARASFLQTGEMFRPVVQSSLERYKTAMRSAITNAIKQSGTKAFAGMARVGARPSQPQPANGVGAPPAAPPVINITGQPTTPPAQPTRAWDMTPEQRVARLEALTQGQ